MPTMEEMAAKGAGKLRRKAESMSSGYNAAKERMKANFRAVGFGPIRTANYSAGVDGATFHAPSPDKWQANWLAKMRM